MYNYKLADIAHELDKVDINKLTPIDDWNILLDNGYKFPFLQIALNVLLSICVYLSNSHPNLILPDNAGITCNNGLIIAC